MRYDQSDDTKFDMILMVSDVPCFKHSPQHCLKKGSEMCEAAQYFSRNKHM